MKLSDDNPFNEELLDNLVKSENMLNTKEVQLSTMLKLKARTKWVKEGSANTNFFHTKLKVRFKHKEVNISEALLEVIPNLITTDDQAMFDVVPTMEEIKQNVFEMDPDSSPGPYGFSGSFYRACWKIIQDDVVKAVQFCWKRTFIPKGLNSNFLVLIPKVAGARSPQQYMPIGLSNVSFKNFTKIISSRMSSLMHKLISPQQAAYIKGRNIQDQIILASEMVNEMKKKRRNDTWCEWLSILFESARISVMINGGPNGFFSVGRGLRQGDPLSPILFVLMEDVLSRNLTKLVKEDDVFIFCNGGKKSVQNLLKLLEEYQDSSGQVINKSKSKLFVDGTSTARTLQIKEIMQMEVNCLPDKYLGVILHSGRPGLKWAWNHLKENIRWCLGDGQKISFWFDSWLSNSPLIEEVGVTEYVKEHINLKVSDLILEGKWNLPEELQLMLTHYTLPEIGVGDDILIWKGEVKGNFTTASAINLIRNKEQPLQCYKKIWNSFLHPSIASNIWKLIQGVYVDDSVMVKRGFELASRCCICEEEQDNMHHLLWECKFSKKIWHWICSVFNFTIPKSFEEVWSRARNKSPFIKECWIIAACAILKELWFQKNKLWFEQIKSNIQSFKARIKKTIYEGSLRMTSYKWISDIDNQVILFFNLEPRKNKFQYIKTCFWRPPSPGFIMFCCDGASIGNP
ncbi:uncharacterized protein LOC113295699 [Papaver somniferum]|uniref:uncharacterized protein LOC113295699 n=1 Tax=Papaver somniferum TaxID=3469 RepID=UPI000E701820|nr:uncharacterized protein LOC113295699 [Papaver somniferum]